MLEEFECMRVCVSVCVCRSERETETNTIGFQFAYASNYALLCECVLQFERQHLQVVHIV